MIYPGHDYKGYTASTVGEEKAFYPRLGAGNNLETFSEIMDNLNLPAQARLEEFLPGSVNLPLQIIHQAYDQLDKNKPVIVFCHSGARSAQAQSLLQQAGFDSVHNLGAIHKLLTC